MVLKSNQSKMATLRTKPTRDEEIGKVEREINYTKN